MHKLSNGLKNNYVQDKVQDLIDKFKYQEKTESSVKTFWEYTDYLGKAALVILIIYELYEWGLSDPLKIVVTFIK